MADLAAAKGGGCGAVRHAQGDAALATELWVTAAMLAPMAIDIRA